MSRLPSPRIQGLIVRELAGELVVYDKTRHRAFCLNPTVASIWKSCEGRTSPGQARRRLEAELGRPVPDAVVSFGVDQLGKAGLLQDAVSSARKHPSRREVLRSIGVAGGRHPPHYGCLPLTPLGAR